MAAARDRRRRNGLVALTWAAWVWASLPATAQPAGEWSTGAALPAPRRLLAAAAVEGRVYAFGGCGSPCFSPPQHVSVDEETRVEVYDPAAPAADRWQRRRPMPYVFFGGAAAAPGDGFVYTLGGMVSPGVVERYDPAAKDWSRRAALPTPRHGLAAVALGDLVYAVGGSDGRAATGALEIYDPAADAWTRGPPLPTPRAQLAAAAVGGRLFAIGGSPDCCGGAATAVVEVYDPATGAWTAAAPLPSPRQVSAAAAIDGRLYVFGGFVPGAGVLAETLEYDPELDRWTRLADLPTLAGEVEEGAVAGRDQAAVAVLGRRAVLVGGSVDCHCRALPDVVIFEPDDDPEPPADLSCTLAAPAALAADERAVYVLTVTNAGPGEAVGSLVTARLPPQVTGRRWTCRAFGGAACPAAGRGELAERVDLPPGASVRFELVATVTAAATCPVPTELAATARVSAPAGVDELRPADDACAAVTAYAPRADLALEQKTATDVPLRGRDVVFLLTASNRPGPDAACPASVTSILPPWLSGPRWTCLAAPGLCTPSAGGVIVDLPAGGDAILTLTALVAADAPCQFPHKAAIAPPAGVVDRYMDNNTAEASVVLALCEPPTVTKTVSPVFFAVSPVFPAVEYVVTLVNPSAVPLPDAPGDEWVDTLPPEVSPLEISADDGVAELDGQTARWNGALPAGGSVEIRLLAKVEPGNAGLVVCNQGTFAADADADGTVELLLLSDDPALPGAADPTCFAIVPEDVPGPDGPVPIPALGGAGRLLVVVLIAVVGVIVLRRWGRRGRRRA